MRRAIITALALTWLVAFGAVRRAEAERLYGLGYSYRLGTEVLTSFDSVTPGITGPPLPITGLRPNELLVGIDFRPATGQLYGVSASSVYTINPDTGAATFVAALSSTLHGAGAGMDFDPVADRLRVVVDSDPDNKHNKLINVDTGGVVNGEFSFDDAANSAGDSAPLFGIAYSNNSASATSATLFGVTNSFDRFNLAVEGPPGSGIFHIVGRLNNPLDSGNTVAVGFDISGLTGLAYIIAFPKLLPGQGSDTSYVHLFTVNLGTGETADMGVVGNERVFFRGLAAPVAPRNESEDDARAFVRRHYYDFLSRDPDAPGLAFWVNEIEKCGSDEHCREVMRVHVSAAFFFSTEFQETGFLAHRTYKAAFGDIPSAPVPFTFFDFLPAKQKLGEGVVVGQGVWQSRLEENKVAFFNSVVSGWRFTSLLLLTPSQFVDTLNQHTGGALTAGERDALVAELAAADTPKARGRILRKVAENDEFKRREMSRAFVLMEYFGYLRRNPADPPELTLDYQGYAYWLEKLDRFGGDYVKAEMVKAFISSDEYRKRFRPL